jgi:hypothetical protein
MSRQQNYGRQGGTTGQALGQRTRHGTSNWQFGMIQSYTNYSNIQAEKFLLCLSLLFQVKLLYNLLVGGSEFVQFRF